MTGKRKASDDGPGPASSRPPPPQRLRMEEGYDDDSTVSSGDSRSDGTYVAENEDSSSSAGAGNVGSEGGDFDIAEDLLELNIQPQNQEPAEWEEELAAADGQHAEAVVQQQQPPADQPAAAEVADQPVPAAVPAPEMVVPAADPVLCLGCGVEPASLRPEPVEHACLCLPCRSSPFGVPHCEYCDAPRH